MVKCVSQGHTAGKQESWSLNPGLSDFDTTLLDYGSFRVRNTVGGITGSLTLGLHSNLCKLTKKGHSHGPLNLSEWPTGGTCHHENHLWPCRLRQVKGLA